MHTAGFKKICFVFFFLLYSHSFVLSIEVGRIFIGKSEYDITALYTFNQNSLATSSIPIFMLLLDNQTLLRSPDYSSPSVSVSCEIINQGVGYSSATFRTVSVSTTRTTAAIHANIGVSAFGKAGRPASIQCWGVSSSSSQFTKKSSMSPARLFEVTRPGTVSICDGVVLVPNDGSVTTGNFYVELSEAVNSGSSVLVNCQITPNTTGCPINPTFIPATFVSGEKRKQMDYTVSTTSSCARQPTEVYCLAQSSNGGTQFQSNSSRGSDAIFILDDGYAILQPAEGISIQGTSFRAVLSVNSTTQATFYCTAQVVNSTSQGRSIAGDGTCPIPTDSTTPAPNSTFTTSGVTTNSEMTATASFASFSDASTFTSTGILSTHSSVAASAFTSTDTASDPTATGGITVTSTTTAIPPTYNQTGAWTVSPSTVNFNSFQSQLLIVERSSGSLIAATEIILVKCCAPPQSNSDVRYINKTTSLLAAVYLSANLPINYTASTPAEDLLTESTLINPAYVEVSPCPCNLTSSACDTNCCCDTDCTTSDISTFTCIPGVEGGYAEDIVNEHFCAARPFPAPDYFAILCVEIVNSAFLGYYIYPRAAIRTTLDYTSNSTAYQPSYSYEDTAVRNQAEVTQGYATGISIKTGLEKDATINVGPNFRMGLPRPTGSGECVWPAPVRFQTESSSVCVYKRSLTDLCSSFSPLNARLFAQSTRWSNPPCPNGPQVLTAEGVTTLADTDVNYLCLGSNVSNTYVKSLANYTDLLPTGQAVLFNVSIDNSTVCFFDTNTKAYLCGNQTVIGSLTGSSPPPRCDFDDGYTKPPAPRYDPITNICYNAVVDVLYNFTWKGQSIVSLNATLILADIPLNQTYNHSKGNSSTAASVVTPHYKVTYTYSVSNDTVSNTTDITSNTTTSTPVSVRYRSGNPGYDDDLPVLSGVLDVQISNTSQRYYINTSDLSRLSTWIPGVDNLCTNANRGTVRFRQNTFTQCSVLLNLDVFADCYNLRRQILNQQDRMMPSNYISVFGDPDVSLIYGITNTTNWLPIFRQDLSYLFSNVSASNSTTNQTSTALPITTAAPLPDNETQAGATYFSTAPGQCINIPSGIHIDILYAVAGTSNWGVIREIVGAKISYSLSTWRLQCASGSSSSSSCIGSSSESTQHFFLSSSVNFIQVSPTGPASISRYDSERQNTSNVCLHDTCWSNMFYPFLSTFPGDPYYYSFAFSLYFLLILIGVFCITRPWW